MSSTLEGMADLLGRGDLSRIRNQNFSRSWSVPCIHDREDGGAGKSFTVPFSRLVESDPDWIIVAPCGLDLATTRKEMGPLESHPEW